MLMPLLTRLYAVEAFGYFAIYVAMTNLIGIFSTLRLEQTVPIAEDQREADAVSTLTVLMSLIAGLAVAVATTIPQVRGLLPTMKQDWYIWGLTAASATFMGWIQILTQRLLRNGKLKYAAMRHIAEKASFLIIAIWAASAKHTNGGLIVAQTVGNFVAVLMLMIGCAWLPKITFHEMFRLARKYSDFPRLNTASMALQLFTTQLPILLYSYYFTPEFLGYLNLAQRLAEAPNTVVSGALAPVFYRRLLTAGKHQYRRIFLRTTLWSATAFSIPMILFALNAQTIIDFVFGAKWHASMPFFLALAPLTVTRLCYMIQQCWLIMLRHLDVDLKISALLLAAQGLGIFIGLFFFSTLLEPVIAAAALTSVVYIAGMIWISRLIHRAHTAPLPQPLSAEASLT